MPALLPRRPIARGRAVARRLQRRMVAATRPAAAPVTAGALVDLVRSKSALLAENARLRHQLAILRRSAGGLAAPRSTACCWCSWPVASAPRDRRC